MKPAMTDASIFEYLLSNSQTISTDEVVSLAYWKKQFFEQASNWRHTVDKAIACGFISDRIAYAFTSGYWSALTRLVPTLPDKKISALCVTEKEGNHPRSIHTTLKSTNENNEPVWRLDGSKSFVTCANDADILLIAASTGISPNGQNTIRLIRVDTHTHGIVINPLNDIPFIPEISHGKLELQNVRISSSQILPGDGYTDYVKPFRTLEDIHVTSAILGYMFRTGCVFNWPQHITSQILSILSGIKSISLDNPLDNTLHILLGGISSLFESFVISLEPYWKLTDSKTESQWNRDKKLLTIASNAREKRLLSAWNYINY